MEIKRFTFYFWVSYIFHYIKYKKNFILFFTFIGIFVRRIYSTFNFFKSDSLKSQASENIYLNIFLENFEKLFEFKLENISLILKNEILIDRILLLFLMIYLLIKLFNINSENNFNILNILFLIFDYLERNWIRIIIQISFFIYNYCFCWSTTFPW